MAPGAALALTFFGGALSSAIIGGAGLALLNYKGLVMFAIGGGGGGAQASQIDHAPLLYANS